MGKTGFGRSRRKLLQTHFRQSFESWVAGLRPVCFLVTFCTMQKVTTRSPSQAVSRFSKPQISAPQPQLRTATIKTFLRKLRGFVNLETAHKNNKFPLTKLNPFEKFRGFVNLDLVLQNSNFPPHQNYRATANFICDNLL